MRVPVERRKKTFALALGGGGARGLAQIAVLEALDDIGARPAAIAGSSIGAAIGAAYAAGMPGKAIRRHVIRLAHGRADTIARLLGARATTLSDLILAPFGNPMLLDAEKFIAAFLPPAVPEDFSALAVPLIVPATDLYGRSEGVLATLQVMAHTIVAEKLKHGAPDLLIRPNVGAFRMLDFFQASAILRAAEPVKAEVKQRLRAMIEA